MDLGAEGTKTLLDSAEAPVDLSDIPNLGFTIGTKRGDEKSHSRTYVRAGELCSAKFVGAQNHRSVGITKNDAGAHFQKAIDEKEAGFKKLFMNQHRALALGGGDQGDGSHVGREAGPRRIGNMRNRSTKLLFDFEGLPLGNENILPLDFRADTQPAEGLKDHPHVLGCRVFDFKVTAGDSRQGEKRSRFQVVGTDPVGGAFQGFYPLDGQGVGADAGNSAPHGVEQVAQGLHVGFARGVVEDSDALGHDGGTKTVFRGGDRGFIEKDVGSLEFFGFDVNSVLDVGDLSSQGGKNLKVGV